MSRPSADMVRCVAAPISHANMTRVDGELIVTWRGGGDVSVFVSADPADAGVDVRAPDGPGLAVLEPGLGVRPYVHLFDPGRGFEVVAERRIQLDGPENFRDIGGYPVEEGGRTRWGRVYRSDRLDTLTDRDQSVLEMLGVDTVFDLRAPFEVEQAPDRLPAGMERVHLPLTSDVAEARPMIERIRAGDLTRFDVEVMVAGYVRMLDRFGPAFVEMVASVASGDTIVVHCTAGKDRTGITAMLLLMLAGVADGHVLDDYEISDRYRSAPVPDRFVEALRDLELDPSDFSLMFRSPRAAMRETVGSIRDRWGSVPDYLSAAGLDQGTLEAARAALVRDL